MENSATDPTTQIATQAVAIRPINYLQNYPDKIKQAQEIAAKFDPSNPTALMEYAEPARSDIAKTTDALVHKIKTRDTGVVEQNISQLVGYVREMQTDALSIKTKNLMHRIPIISSLYDEVRQYLSQAESVGEKIDKVTEKLRMERISLNVDIANGRQLKEENWQRFLNLQVYVFAGEEKITEMRQQLVLQQEEAEKSQDPVKVNQAVELENRIRRLERRVYSLKIGAYLAIQADRHTEAIQNSDMDLVESIQDTILIAVPAWKQSIIMYVMSQNQRKAMELKRKVSDSINQSLKDTSEKMHENAVEAAKESNRGIVDIETLRQTTDDLVNSIIEVRNIAEEGRKQQREADQILNDMTQRIQVAMLPPKET